MTNFLALYGDIIIKLLVAVLLGSLVGLERLIAGKQAGMRTYSLVSLGSCLFVLVSEMMSPVFSAFPGFNPAMIASQIIAGVGFLGAGMIIFQGRSVHGLTTAAGFWLTAGLGMAVGFGLYIPAIISTILALFIFSGLWWVEKMISPDLVPEKEK